MPLLFAQAFTLPLQEIFPDGPLVVLTTAPLPAQESESMKFFVVTATADACTSSTVTDVVASSLFVRAAVSSPVHRRCPLRCYCNCPRLFTRMSPFSLFRKLSSPVQESSRMNCTLLLQLRAPAQKFRTRCPVHCYTATARAPVQERDPMKLWLYNCNCCFPYKKTFKDLPSRVCVTITAFCPSIRGADGRTGRDVLPTDDRRKSPPSRSTKGRHT